MREHLLGYLMGALDPEESQNVEQCIQGDAELRRQMDALRNCLSPLAADRGPVDPPFGLAMRTCQFVAAQSQVVVPGVLPGQGWGGSSGWRLQDLVVAAGVLLAASMLFFPAVRHSRYNAQLAGCQDNLRQLGVSLISYSQINGNSFPTIPEEGNQGVGGIVAPILTEEQQVEPRRFLCPGKASSRKHEFRIPTREQLNQADPKLLPALHRELSGDYGYHLGVTSNGKYIGHRNLGRSTFGLMADVPCYKLGGKQSSNHGGHGQNLLYEDGHVKFQTQCRSANSRDDIFHNDEGYVAAGTHLNDAVIGHSTSKPILRVRQQ